MDLKAYEQLDPYRVCSQEIHVGILLEKPTKILSYMQTKKTLQAY